jgi:alpha-beta hydrolase superfamily lysophospholipase
MVEEFYWNTADGLRIYGVNWPVPDARAVVGLIHGLGEHSRRYDHWAQRFNERGFGVVGYDRRGHGRSAGKRGHAAGYAVLLAEIAQLLIECERHYPDRPVVLYGHSMGGNLLLNYVLRRNPDIAAAVVSAPHIQLTQRANPLLILLARIVRLVYPAFTQSNTLNLNDLCRDPQVVRAVEQDPYYHDRISVELAISLLRAGDYLNAFAGEVKTPLLLLHGTEDHITDPRATARLAGRLQGPVDLKLWEGLYHELHNEPEREAVFDFVYQWLEPRIEQSDAYRELKSV